MIKSFLDLDVYKESFQLMLEIEELVKLFPPSEKFLLVDQMKRASRSIPAQIAEGYARRESLKDFQRYLRDCVGEESGYGEELIERYTIVGKKLSNLKNNWQNFDKSN